MKALAAKISLWVLASLLTLAPLSALGQTSPRKSKKPPKTTIITPMDDEDTAEQAKKSMAPPESASGPVFSFHAAALAMFPIAVGAQGAVRIGSRLMFYLQGGVVPDPFVSSADSIAQSIGAYDSETGDLVRTLLPGSTYIEVGGRYAVGNYRRWYLEGGIGALRGQSQSTGKDVLEVLLGRTLPGASGNTQIPIEGEVTAFKLGFGYTSQWKGRWFWDLSLAVLHPISSTTTMDIPGLSGGALEQAIVNELDSYMADVYAGLYLPALTLAVRY
ncbi:MAG: hypothetical protein IT288_14925 [Bdellovibrionales bacterium]|nr:hypothetical protein [Bdellovibrionales bacterium]